MKQKSNLQVEESFPTLEEYEKVTEAELREHLAKFKKEKPVTFNPENYNKEEDNKAMESFEFLEDILKGKTYGSEENHPLRTLSSNLLEEIYDYVKIDYINEFTKKLHLDILLLVATRHKCPIHIVIEIITIFNEFYLYDSNPELLSFRKTVKQMNKHIASNLIWHYSYLLVEDKLNKLDLSYKNLETLAYFLKPGGLHEKGFSDLLEACYKHPNFTTDRMLQDFVNN